jgi:hypothetical protein
MKIQIFEHRLDDWRILFDTFPQEERQQISLQRFKEEGAYGPNYIEIWEVSGTLEQHIQTNFYDWAC